MTPLMRRQPTQPTQSAVMSPPPPIREFRRVSCNARHSPKSPDAPKGLRAFCFWRATLCRCRSSSPTGGIIECDGRIPCGAAWIRRRIGASGGTALRVTKRSSLTISNRIYGSPPEKVRERCGHSSIWQSATLPTSRLSVRGRLSAPSLQRPKCSVWSFSAHMKSGARKGVAVMEKVSAVCRLARSKSSALGAENRRFKSFHTDPRLIGFFRSKNTNVRERRERW